MSTLSEACGVWTAFQRNLSRDQRQRITEAVQRQFDTRPLFVQRQLTGAMHRTVALEWQSQVRHGLHLFFIIATAVIARNVANQEVLEAVGPSILGQLYLGTALTAGLAVAAVGWVGRAYEAHKVARVLHGSVGVVILAAFNAPARDGAVAVVMYLAMEVSSALLLLAFGIMLGARFEPRDAKRVAARVGAGGILGGLFAGATLSFGALFLGSRPLLLVAAAFALAPMLWLPPAPGTKPKVLKMLLGRERPNVGALAPYGRWVGITTLLMVAATTLVDYQFRFAAKSWFRADNLTAFFGFVVILAGCTTLLFQFLFLNRLLNRLGLFAVASVMPAALIIAGGLFGLVPVLATLVVLKLVDSGANMSLQQATGGLLLAPLGSRARSVWQGRIDGLFKRSGQALTGLFLAAFPWPPAKVLPLTLLLCGAWMLAVAITRSRYIRLLTEMLEAPASIAPELGVYDGNTLRLLEAELHNSSPRRAALILDLLASAEHRAPDELLRKVAERDPRGPGILAVVSHLSELGDAKALMEFTNNANPDVATSALTGLAVHAPAMATSCCHDILLRNSAAEQLRAMAAGLIADTDEHARELCQELASSGSPEVKLALAQGLGGTAPGGDERLASILCQLALNEETATARAALSAMATHPSSECGQVALEALQARELRGEAMRTLVGFGPIIAGAVAKALQDQRENPRVAASLSWVLGRLGTTKAVPALVTALAAPHAETRLSASVALTSLHRRFPDVPLPQEQLATRYEPEICFYGRMRDASLSQLPTSPAAVLLRRLLKHRAQASLETLFRLFALRYPEDSITGAFLAISSNDRSRRQLALELLDTLLEQPIRQALGHAVGASSGPKRSRAALTLVRELAEDCDAFLAALSRAALVDLQPKNEDDERHYPPEDTMAEALISQVLELQSLVLFNDASAEDLAEMARLLTYRRVPRGTYLFREGDMGDAVYFIKEGTIQLSRGGRPADRLGPGEACGLVAVLDRLPREVTAEAATECGVLVIRGEELIQLLADRPLLMHSVFRALTNSLRAQEARIDLGKKAPSS